MTTKERFWKKVEKRGCWIWTGTTTQDGYGLFCIKKGNVALAHRFAHEMLVGPIPDGLEIDHLCRMRGCVNPEHMEVVTHKENCKRGRMPTHQRFKQPTQKREPIPRGAHNTAKTHCPKGHPYTPENTYLRHNNPNRRECLTCKRESQKRWKRSRK